MSIPDASGTVISFPIPPYSNPPIHDEYYIPNRFVIDDVDLGVTTIVTTTEDHNYVIGQECRLIIPPTFGCRQLNGVLGIVLSIPSVTQVELNIDSSLNVDPYFASSATTVAQILGIGDVNLGATNAFGRYPTLTYIPGSFRNISPI